MPPAALVAVALLAGPTRFAGPLAPDKLVDLEAAVNARLAAGVTPDTNALVPLWGVYGLRPGGAGKPLPDRYFARLGVPAPPPDGDYFRDFNVFAKDRAGDDEDAKAALDREFGAALKKPWKPGDSPAMAEWLEANAGPLDRAREAVKRPAYFNPTAPAPDADGNPGLLIGSLLPHAQAARGLGAALSARAMLRTGAGDAAGAWADILAQFRLARHVGSGGTMIEALVGVAADQTATEAALAFVREAKLTPAQLAACRRDLDALPPLADPARRVDVVERAVLQDALNHLRRDMTLLGGDPKFKTLPAAWKALDWTPAAAKMDDFMDRAVAVMRAPDPARRRSLAERFDRDLKALKPTRFDQFVFAAQVMVGRPGPAVVRVSGNLLIPMMMLNHEKIMLSFDRAAQTRRNARVAFALAAYKLDRGDYPPDLLALVPAYLPAVPPSAFTGTAPGYERTPAGYDLRTPPPADAPKSGGPYAGVSVPPKTEE